MSRTQRSLSAAASTLAARPSARLGGSPAASPDPVVVSYRPILDIARGVAAGYQAQVSFAKAREVDVTSPGPLSADVDGSHTAAAAHIALAAVPTLPPNTFLAVPLPVHLADLPVVRRALLAHARETVRPLAGIVLDLIGPVDVTERVELFDAVTPFRDAGAMISVGGYGAPQPELSTILRLRPEIVRLGRDWVRDLDTSPGKRTALETIGSMAGQLDSWILVEGVASARELRVLADLAVPLAQGPFVGDAHAVWPGIAEPAQTALPTVGTRAVGVLRTLLHPAYTASDAAAVTAVLPETTGLGVVVVLGADARPVTVIEQDGTDAWVASDALIVNVDTSVNDVVLRALTRPRSCRFAPVVCTDDRGRLLGVLRMERLISHLAATEESVGTS